MIVKLPDGLQLAIPEWMLSPETCERLRTEALPDGCAVIPVARKVWIPASAARCRIPPGWRLWCSPFIRLKAGSGAEGGLGKAPFPSPGVLILIYMAEARARSSAPDGATSGSGPAASAALPTAVSRRKESASSGLPLHSPI